MDASYVAGTLDVDSTGQHVLALDFFRSGVDSASAVFLCRFIEGWCEEQCCGDWRIEHSIRNMSLHFTQSRDCVLFKLTHEYDYMRSHSMGLAI